jgi:tetratricopeptide (TPR) repeat protein
MQSASGTEEAGQSTTFTSDPDTPVSVPVVTKSVLLWVNKNTECFTDDNRRAVMQLPDNVENIEKSFGNLEEFYDYLTSVVNEKVSLIVSGDWYEQLMEHRARDLPQLDSIYILCENMSSQEQWKKKNSKLKGAYTHIQDICKELERTLSLFKYCPTSINFFPIDSDTKLGLNEFDRSFVVTQIWKEILLKMKDHERCVTDFIAHYREQYSHNENLTFIEKFEHGYCNKSSIWWFTNSSYIFYILNEALRTQNVKTLFKMGFILRDMDKQIKQLHNEQFGDHQESTFTVYRGQGMSQADLEKIIKTKDGLIFFNQFLSTSNDRHVAAMYAESNAQNPKLKSIVFDMKIDTSILSTHFADLKNVSCFHCEMETLFSMHSVFRIGRMQQDETNHIWSIQLKQVSDSEHDLSVLIKLMREETQGPAGWSRLGQLLIEIGEFDNAEEMYAVLLDQTSDDGEKVPLYHQLALVKVIQGDYDKALSFYQKSHKILEKTASLNPLWLAISYNNMGLAYSSKGKDGQALKYCKKARDICEANPTDHPDFSIYFSNIGSVYENTRDYFKALFFHEKVKKIRLPTLPLDDLNLDQSYHNSGFVYMRIGEYSLDMGEEVVTPNHGDLATSSNSSSMMYGKTRDHSQELKSEKKLLEKKQKNLPPDHPLLAVSYNIIGEIYENMGNYSEALLSYKKELDIRKKSVRFDHPDLSTCYANIGNLYEKQKEYLEASAYHEKALETARKHLSPAHPLLTTSCEKLAAIYKEMGNNPQASSFDEQTIQCKRRTLLLNCTSLAICYNNIGLLLKKMGKYSKALVCLQNCLGIHERVLGPDHPNLARFYSNIGSVHYNMHRYQKALSSYQIVLEIDEKVLLSDHSSLAMTHNSCGSAYERLQHYFEAYSSYEKAVEIGRRSLPSNHLKLKQWEDDFARMKTKIYELSTNNN